MNSASTASISGEFSGLGELVLACRYIPRGNGIVGVGIDRDCSLELRFPEGRPLDQILEVAAAVQDLVTIGVAAPSRVSGIWLSHSSTQRPIRLWTKWRGDDVDAGESRAIHPAEMLFTYDVIGGLEGVGRWLTVWKEFSLCAGTLTAKTCIGRPSWSTRLSCSGCCANVGCRRRPCRTATAPSR